MSTEDINAEVKRRLQEMGHDVGGERSENEECPESGDDPEAGPTWQTTFGFPRPPDDVAYHGLPGDVVDTFGPHTEAGRPAILGQFLVAFGNAVGRQPYFQVGGDRHRVNLYLGVVGPSGKGRKGSGLSVALLPVENADPVWAAHAKAFGLSTGEGVIHHLRDAKINAKGEEIGEGAKDKRLLAVETEFSRVLRTAARPESILSMVLRQGWDAQTLQTMSKTAAEVATSAHLSLVAHTTRADLTRHLDDVDVLNGFANRFVWLASQRERWLPDGGKIEEDAVRRLGKQTGKALAFARDVRQMTRSDAAQKLWGDVYVTLTGDRHGAFGAVTGRADAQVLRLSMIYALATCSKVIEEDHLRAALALWEYSERSTLWIFGWSTGSRQADMVLAELRVEWPAGLTRKQIRDMLGRNHPVSEPLAMLEEQKLASSYREQPDGPGRPAQVWLANPDPPNIGITSFKCTSQRAQAS